MAVKAAPRVGLVAGGGAVKAYAFHVGVVRALEEDGFFFASGLRWEPRLPAAGRRCINLYVGSSAGACVCTSLAAGHAPGIMGEAVLGTSREVPTFGYRTLFVPVAPNPRQYLDRLARRWKLGQLRPHHLLETGGLLTTAGVERYFRRHVLPSNRFGDLAVPLFIAATQVNSSRKVVFGPVDSMLEEGYDEGCAYYDNVKISEALAAAVAVPPIFAPYTIVNPSSGQPIDYYDGEVRETLSVHIARDAGADFVIASSIWQPYQYDERVGSLAKLGITALAEQAIHQIVGAKVEQDRQRAARYDRLLELLEQRGTSHGLSAEAVATLQAEICRVLHHRPTRTLYVTPVEKETDFFFEGSFRFNRPLLERCIEAGRRAYREAVRRDPEFLAALDQRLSEPTPAARPAVAVG